MTSMSLFFLLVLVESSYLISAISASILLSPYQNGSSLDCWVTVEESIRRQPNGRQTENHQLVCFPIVDGHQSDYLLVLDGLPNTFAKEHDRALRNGELYISLDGTIIVEKDHDIHVRGQSSFKVIPRPTIQRPRRLTTTGDMTVAFVRVNMRDAQVTASAQEIKDAVMGQSANMMSQLLKNSFGKLRLTPARGVGVYEVYVDNTIGSYAQGSSTHADVQNAIKEQLKVAEMQDLADRVFFCIPPGTQDGDSWVAVASPKYGIASFNNEYCSSLSTTIHEFMHTLGLGHSHLSVDGDYQDLSCYQGASLAATDWPQQMFNAHKHWQLGWFADRHASFNLDDDAHQGGPVLIEIAAVVDYDKAATNQPVLVEINEHYYMQYNRVKGFNSENQQEIDRIVVVESLDDGVDSIRVGGVDGTIGSLNINYSGRTLTIHVCETRYGTTDAEPDVMVVSVGFGAADCSAPPLLLEVGLPPPDVFEPISSLSPSKSPMATPTRVHAPSLRAPGPTPPLFFSPNVAPSTAPVPLSIQQPSQAPTTKQPDSWWNWLLAPISILSENNESATASSSSSSSSSLISQSPASETKDAILTPDDISEPLAKELKTNDEEEQRSSRPWRWWLPILAICVVLFTTASLFIKRRYSAHKTASS